MTAKEELTSISQLLHLAHHRNKNQHRLSKWYKSFSQLRRQVSKLLAEIESLETAERFDVTGTGKGKAGKGKGKLDGKESKYVKAAREKVEARVEFLEERVVEKCYL
jgi:ribonuclease MRP protein subunit RMP1